MALRKIDYAYKVFAFIYVAKKLQSLRISCTHVFDIDLLLLLTHLHALRVLERRRIKTSIHHLKAPVTQSHASLASVFLVDVALKSGTWTSPLLALYDIPNLVRFYIMHCGYANPGQSTHHSGTSLDRYADVLSTLYAPDVFGLEDVERHVIAMRRARGLPEMRRGDYKFYGNRMSAEEDLSTNN